PLPTAPDVALALPSDEQRPPRPALSLAPRSPPRPPGAPRRRAPACGGARVASGRAFAPDGAGAPGPPPAAAEPGRADPRRDRARHGGRRGGAGGAGGAGAPWPAGAP